MLNFTLAKISTYAVLYFSWFMTNFWDENKILIRMGKEVQCLRVLLASIILLSGKILFFYYIVLKLKKSSEGFINDTE